MKHIPISIQTQELCDAAIKSICWAIQYCREEFKTPLNCISAVSRNGETIQYVPREFITAELCMAAAKSEYESLEFIPREFITRDICEAAVGANGKNIKYVPEEFMSTELAYLAITVSEPSDPSSNLAGANIQYIPAKYLNKEIIVESARRWDPTYRKIPKECLTEEIENAVIDAAPFCIKYMEQTPEKCMRAIKVNPCSIDCIHEKNRTAEMAAHVLGLETIVRRRISSETLEHLMMILCDAPQ